MTEALFTKTVKEYGQKLRNTVLGIIKDESVVEDILQGAYYNAWKYRDSFKGDSSMYTWFHRIALNETFQYIRKAKKQQAELRDPILLDDLEGPESLSSPDEYLRMSELGEEFWESLNDDCREVLEIRKNGMSERSAARVLQCNKNTMKSRYFRAKKILITMVYLID